MDGTVESLEIEDIFLIPGGKGCRELSAYRRRKKPAAFEAGCGGIIFLHDGPNASAMLARTGLLFPQTGVGAYDENWKRMFAVGDQLCRW